MYRRFLRDLSEINPYLKIAGLTATPYRLDSGMLHEGPEALFDAIAYDVSVRDLIDQGYLCKLVSKKTATQLDVTGVGTRGGEFIPGQLEAAVDLHEITAAAVREIVKLGVDRKFWLIYGAGIDHCRHKDQEIRAHGIEAQCIFGETHKDERADLIARFKVGDLRCLCSMGVLTTGFNAPNVDLLAMLRPTKSTGLYVQIVGRATRVAPGKDDALILDFAGNVRRHGPIDAVVPKEKGEGDGEAPTKVCPECSSYVPVGALTCPDCGYEFVPLVRNPPLLAPVADTLPILSDHRPQWVDVTAVTYARHQKLDKPDSLCVTYHAGLVSYREWICLEHPGFARDKACKWWIRRAPGMPVPASITAALEIAPYVLARPTEIAVRRNGKYFDIVGAKFG
jgi:DNA repair protein RadD